MKMAGKFTFCCLTLRAKCFIIAYLNLFAVIVDIICHVIVVAIVTRGFQCDVDEHSLRQVDWPWLEYILVIINVGTHGFYPFPLAPHSQKMQYLEYLRPAVFHARSQCYPGIVHVHLIDVLNFMINFIWLNFVKSYMVALHKKDYAKMNIFFIVSIVKIVLQIIYFGYQPDLSNFGVNQAFWIIKFLDISLATCYLVVIHEYRKELKKKGRQAAARRLEEPPSYIDCLITGTYPVKRAPGSSKDEPVVIDDINKFDIEVITLCRPNNNVAPINITPIIPNTEDGASQS